MPSRPRHTKPDRNQRQIIDGLEALGFVVWDIHDLPGLMDLIVCWRGRCLPVEVKYPGHEADLTPGEAQAIIDLAGVGVGAIVATCVEDVVRAFEDLRDAQTRQ